MPKEKSDKSINIPNISGDNLLHFRDYIKQRGGIYLDDVKLEFLRTILLNRISIHDFKGYLQYYQFLKFHPSGEAEFKELLETLTINETCFFRNTSHFSVLEKYILPELMIKRLAGRSKYLRIWSAGCSSGEEPYSLAMLIAEMIPDYKKWSIEILATDINNRVMEIAKNGIYKKYVMRKVNDYYKNKYFIQQKGVFKISENIKKMVNLRYFNLLNEPYPLSAGGRWDIIFCCNVLIYFQLETVRQVVKNFYNNLQENGYFFTGYAETSQIIANDFQLVRMDDAFFYKKVKTEPVQKAVILPKVPVAAGEVIPAVKFTQVKKEIPLVKPVDSYNEAMELFIKEDYSGALKKINEFLQNNQNEARALLLLARIYLEKGMLHEVLSVSGKIIEMDPLNDTAYYLAGFTYKQKKDFAKAIEFFKKAIYLNRNNILAYYNLALVYKQKGEDKMTLREFKNTLKALSENSSVEPLELSGHISPELLIDTCRKNINKLSESESL